MLLKSLAINAISLATVQSQTLYCKGAQDGMAAINRLFQSPPNVQALVLDSNAWSDSTFTGNDAIVVNNNAANYMTEYTT